MATAAETRRFVGAWQVRIENTFLTIHDGDDDDDDAAGPKALRRASSCPPARAATQQSEFLLSEAEFGCAETEPAFAGLEVQGGMPLTDSQGPEAGSATARTTDDPQDGAGQNDATIGHAPRDEHENADGVPTMGDSKPFGFYGVFSMPPPNVHFDKAEFPAEQTHEDGVDGVPENAVILRNIPSRLGEDDMLLAIAGMGFYGVLEGFNMPMRADKNGRPLNKGFAFVRFSDRLVCQLFCQAASGYQFKDRKSSKALTARLAGSLGAAGYQWLQAGS